MGQSVEDFLIHAIGQWVDLTGCQIQQPPEGGLALRVENGQIKPEVSDMLFDLIGYSLAETTVGCIDIFISLDSQTPSRILISDLTVLGNTNNYATYKKKTESSEYQGMLEQEEEELADAETGEEKNALDVVPTVIQAWLVNILKDLVLDVVNLRVGLVGGDHTSPWSVHDSLFKCLTLTLTLTVIGGPGTFCLRSLPLP